MKKQTIVLLPLFFVFISAFPQEPVNPNHFEGQTSFYAELGGPGVLFSANFDRRFKPSSLGWGFRAGIGFVTSWDDSYDTSRNYYYYSRQRSVATFPVQVNYIFGKPASPHTFEAGAGLTLLSKKMDVFDSYRDDKSLLLATFSFMYRRQPLNGGFSWRIGFTPIISSGYIQPSGGGSVGFNF
jgi:hypothetical protein